MSGEIERTLEISNQCIINAAVDMSDIQGTATVTSRSVVNANMPPRPERVNVKAPNDLPSKDNEPTRQVYSPISRPSSTEGLEGLAYMHNSHVKNPTHYIHPPQPSPRMSQYSPCTTVSYPPPQPQTSNINRSNASYSSSEQYTPLPRADIKPYHESYFNDVKPIMSIEENRSNFVPEGLAASLQARVLNAQHIKEEMDYEQRRSYLHYTQDGGIKTESVNSDCQYKRESPVIQGPHRSGSGRRPPGFPDLQRNPMSAASPEPHSNTSTPLVDEPHDAPAPRKRLEDGK